MKSPELLPCGPQTCMQGLAQDTPFADQGTQEQDAPFHMQVGGEPQVVPAKRSCSDVLGTEGNKDLGRSSLSAASSPTSRLRSAPRCP